MRASTPEWDGTTVEVKIHAADGYVADGPVVIAVPDRRREPGEGGSYSWVEDHLARLDGKETRAEYYAWLG